MEEIIVNWFYDRGLDPVPYLSIALVGVISIYLYEAYRSKEVSDSRFRWSIAYAVMLLLALIVAILLLL